jgi:hypothetical protein
LTGEGPAQSGDSPGAIVAPGIGVSGTGGGRDAGLATACGGLSSWKTLRLAAEFFGLYLVIPTLAAEYPRELRGWLLPALVVGGAVLFFVLWRDPTFDRKRLWNAAALRRWWWRVLLLVVFFAVAAVGYVALLDPGSLFEFPRERPGLWAAIMVGYPLASVYPQEIIFRTFLFHRYGGLFERRGDRVTGAEQAVVGTPLASPERLTSGTGASWMLIAASTAAFGYAHLMFQSYLAVGLTVLGGLVFARTYARSRSTCTVALEHALYGWVLFTVGLGRYFYLGAVGGP